MVTMYSPGTRRHECALHRICREGRNSVRGIFCLTCVDLVAVEILIRGCLVCAVGRTQSFPDQPRRYDTGDFPCRRRRGTECCTVGPAGYNPQSLHLLSVCSFVQVIKRDFMNVNPNETRFNVMALAKTE